MSVLVCKKQLILNEFCHMYMLTIVVVTRSYIQQCAHATLAQLGRQMNEQVMIDQAIVLRMLSCRATATYSLSVLVRPDNTLAFLRTHSMVAPRHLDTMRADIW